MNTQKLLIKLVALTCGSAASCMAMADTQEEINKQISNMISAAISARIAATSPGTTQLDNGGYGGITNIRVRGTGFSDSTNAYLAGADHNFSKNLIAGAALDYSDPTGGSATGISPYLAYLVNENLYFMGRVRYGTGDFSSGGAKTDLDMWSTGLSINGMSKSEKMVVKGGLEIGSSRVKTDTNMGALGSASTTSSSTTYVANGELGYTFTPGWQGLAGLTLNTSNKSNTYSATAHIALEKELGKDAALQLKYATQVDDNQMANANIKVDVVTLAVRFRF